jgi:hypothetical protein
MLKIYKVEFASRIMMHPGKILKTSYQAGKLHLWYEATTDECDNKYERKFQALPTGSEVEDGLIFIDTVFATSSLVWHIYEVAQ